ncbi:MAG: dimethylsulfonioproprionate lyase family protein [Alphaproteobacteria bacterium]|nr:dimethylsulfonioproprionate lyase family protein [Alphaproteobacteria bacterium]
MTGPARFIEALRNCLAAHVGQEGALGPFIEALRDVAPRLSGRAEDDLKHPLLSQLDGALDAALGPPDLVESVAALASAGGWYQVYTGGGINAEMADFMLAKQIVGPKGIIASTSMRAGIFLLAPHFEYRMHDHAALKIYYVHSGAVDIQNGTDSAPRCLRPGQYSITPSGVPHALQTGAAPVLLLFVWIGNVTAPIWWWVQGDDGVWTQTLAKKP